VPVGIKEVATAAFRLAKLRRRLGLLLLVYFGVAAILAMLTREQYLDAISSAEKTLTAFAQLTDEQTTRTIQGIEQTLEIAKTQVAAATVARTATEASVRSELRTLLADRPFLRAITLLDDKGRVVYSSEPVEAGLDLSRRDYFVHHRDNPASKFLLGVPLRSRSTEEWLIPASEPLRRATGEFAGVVVASLDPVYFARLWTNDKTIKDQATTLWRTDGTVMMRSPFDERSMGTTLPQGVMASRLKVGSGEGTLRAVSGIDGQDRLVAYRRLGGYPEFGLSVTQTTDRALAEWMRTAWAIGLGWAAAGAALAWLAVDLARENMARQATQNRYTLIFQANPYPMVVMDRETRRLLAVNDAAVREYGWSREEILGMPVNEFYAPEDLPALEAMRKKQVVGDYHVVKGLRHRKKDGTIFDVEMHTHSLELDGRPTILTIMENVSVRYSVEAQLRQAQKMEAVGQLTGGIAHDFNNILFVIIANAEALADEEGISEGMSERLRQIDGAVDRASALTRQLLAFSRTQTLRPQQTDLNELVSDTGKLLRRALGAQVEIQSILGDGLCITNIDRAQLEATLVNLCINARDAMPEGGSLLIESRNVILDDDYTAQNPGVVAGHYAMLAVTDTGSGISPETLSRVFEPFFTTKEVGKGTGLGLSMVYGFIQQSKGHIKVYSEMGVGTSFKLYLPCSGQAAEQSLRALDAALRGGSERILVVEDDAQVRASVVQQLQSLGYAVTDAADGPSAIAALEATGDPYDLVLTDVVMPGPLNGKALAAEVTRRWPLVDVMFMSGFNEVLTARNGQIGAGALLLSKPFRKADLARMVRQAMDGIDGTPTMPKAA
jgi:PAS domain S-box-containing protein